VDHELAVIAESLHGTEVQGMRGDSTVGATLDGLPAEGVPAAHTEKRSHVATDLNRRDEPVPHDGVDMAEVASDELIDLPTGLVCVLGEPQADVVNVVERRHAALVCLAARLCDCRKADRVDDVLCPGARRVDDGLEGDEPWDVHTGVAQKPLHHDLVEIRLQARRVPSWQSEGVAETGARQEAVLVVGDDLDALVGGRGPDDRLPVWLLRLDDAKGAGGDVLALHSRRIGVGEDDDVEPVGRERLCRVGGERLP
jgi:hypothetical protein